MSTVSIRKSAGILGLVIGLTMLLASCWDDLGRSCYDNRDCSDVCITGSDYPEGICTHYCNRSTDCPGGWVCIDEQGGICLESCSSSGYCEDYYSRSWACREEDRAGERGKSFVCIGR